MGEVIQFSELVRLNELKKAKEELDIALNIFNEATGDMIDAAIYRYNDALEAYNKIFKEEGVK